MFKKGMDLPWTACDTQRFTAMCAALDEIDQIHEAEEAAKKRIADAEDMAKQIKEDAEKEAKRIKDKAEKEARMAAQRSKDGLNEKRTKIESKILKDAEKTVKEIEESARGEVKKAVKIAYRMIAGEE
ncbi:MAG: hypothetical protein ACE5H4_04675 [Candidatus Thorarchaeota archaeon]